MFGDGEQTSQRFPGNSDSKKKKKKKIRLQCRRGGFDPGVEKTPWRRAWQPTSVPLPGKILWTEEPGGLQSRGSQSVRLD